MDEERRGGWDGGKGWVGGGGIVGRKEIAKRKEVTLIQNEHIPPVFCTSWISLLDILEIIQLSEIRIFCLDKRLRASGF